jgi:hypothetical protein
MRHALRIHMDMDGHDVNGSNRSCACPVPVPVPVGGQG